MLKSDIKIPEDISFAVTSSLIDKRDVMAAQMYLCPKRRNGQSLEQKIAQTQSGIFLEHALQLQGAELNPKEFDVTDRDSYCWDAKWNGLYTEVKRCKVTDSRKWFSFPKQQVKTMLNNIDALDLIIVGDYEWDKVTNICSVQWILVAPTKTFEQNIHQSQYQPNIMYYNHKHEPNSVFLQ